VLSPREVHSRYETYLEHYNKSVNVEANLTTKIAKTTILPAALHYQRQLAEGATAVKAAGFALDTTVLKQVTDLIGKLQAGLAGLDSVTSHHGGDSALAEAKHFCNSVLPAMLKVRESADALEGIVADELWPLPTFQEILFIK
jgi:glutamine synthetase